MEKEQYREFFKHLKGEGLLIPQIDEESFDEYIFDNFKAVLPQSDVIKSVCDCTDELRMRGMDGNNYCTECHRRCE